MLVLSDPQRIAYSACERFAGVEQHVALAQPALAADQPVESREIVAVEPDREAAPVMRARRAMRLPGTKRNDVGSRTFRTDGRPAIADAPGRKGSARPGSVLAAPRGHDREPRLGIRTRTPQWATAAMLGRMARNMDVDGDGVETIIVGLRGAVLWQINARRGAGRAKRSIVDLRQTPGRRGGVGDAPRAIAMPAQLEGPQGSRPSSARNDGKSSSLISRPCTCRAPAACSREKPRLTVSSFNPR